MSKPSDFYWNLGAQGRPHPNGGYVMRCLACGKYEGHSCFEFMPNFCDACVEHLEDLPETKDLPYLPKNLKQKGK